MSMPKIATKYSLSEDSIFRHKRSHLPPQLRARLLAGPRLLKVDTEQLRLTESQSLLTHIQVVRARLFAALTTAEELADLRAVASLTGRLHDNFRLVGELVGEIGGATSITNNIVVDHGYLELRRELMRALAPHPEARQAVAATLHQLESRAATEMKAEGEQQYAHWEPIPDDADEALTEAGGEEAAA